MQENSDQIVMIEGDGIAAVCVARLLTDAGVRCQWKHNTRPKLAAILLGEQAQRLLSELFHESGDDRKDLFEGFTQIRRRVVLWGNAPEAVELPHSGVVAPEAELLRRLWERVPAIPGFDAGADTRFTWTLQTSRESDGRAPELSIGNQVASFSSVELGENIQADACWVESVPSGWLFLLALGGNQATLIAVGTTPALLLAESRLISRQIACILALNSSVPSHPKISQSLASTDRIACGSAAMSFDPLCGEGAGNAVREAFLAAAVIRASLDGQPREHLAKHYSDRLRRGFLRHLQVCLQFYSSGANEAFWKAQSASLITSIEQIQRLLEQEHTMPFKLVDRDLVPA